jgi:glycosyltransferase involved in cell wall biosynthesis
MPEWYRAADVLVHAALREPYGIVFVEAMASGIPVIAHPFEVTEWIVGEGGRMADMTEPGALAAALQSLASDPEARAMIGRSGRERVESNFSLDRVLPLFLDTYRSMVQPAASGARV